MIKESDPHDGTEITNKRLFRDVAFIWLLFVQLRVSIAEINY